MYGSLLLPTIIANKKVILKRIHKIFHYYIQLFPQSIQIGMIGYTYPFY